jgi:predicted acylesterase/phospholipase RssA
VIHSPCAIALTGGVAKGAFHAGVLKSFAELGIVPSVIVGASAGALNGAFAARLIMEEQFTPREVEKTIINMWLYQASFQKLWAYGEIQDNSLRSLVGDVRLSIFMLRRLLMWLTPANIGWVKEFFKLKFTSILSDKHLKHQLEQTLQPPQKIKKEIHFSAAVTSLTGSIETYADQPLVGYGGYLSFHFHPEQSPEQMTSQFDFLRKVVQASGSFPGVFPPVPLMVNGKTDLYTDGGLTKNGPFGRAIKLDPRVRTIFLVSSMPITQPTSGRLDNLLTVVDQIYKIILNKDLANDFRKIQQINERIRLLRGLLKTDESGEILVDNEFNQALLQVAGYSSVESFLDKREVEIVIIEPPLNLEGDPFAGLYRQDRIRILKDYVTLGYDTGTKVLKDFLNRSASASPSV